MRLCLKIALLLPAGVSGLDNGVGLTPAMGYNTWDGAHMQAYPSRVFAVLSKAHCRALTLRLCRFPLRRHQRLQPVQGRGRNGQAGVTGAGV